MSTAVYVRLLQLLPSQPVYVGMVTAVYPDGTAQITFPGGAAMNLRDPFNTPQDQNVYVQNGTVIGSAPTLPYTPIEI